MKILFLGDIVGKSGRNVVLTHVPRLRKELALDFVVANGENAAHGFGITATICCDLFEAGIDVITGGNHSWDQPDIAEFCDRDSRLLRPLNYRPGTPGRGSGVYDLADGRHILVVNIMGRLFMEPLDDPFAALDKALPPEAPALCDIDCVLVDVHGEATSEKYALGHFCDGRASFVVGTHTHVPTADAHIMEKGTAFQSDAGMCGDYNSVIGMKTQASLGRFLGTIPRPRMQPAENEATLCGTVVEIKPTTGLALKIAPIRIGGILSSNWPT